METETLLIKRTSGRWKADKNFVQANFDDGNKGSAWLDIVNCLKLSNNVMPDVREANANAAYICKAVNNHEALLSALKYVDGQLKDFFGEKDYVFGNYSHIHTKINAAIQNSEK